jgi:hypothetical protein
VAHVQNTRDFCLSSSGVYEEHDTLAPDVRKTFAYPVFAAGLELDQEPADDFLNVHPALPLCDEDDTN